MTLTPAQRDGHNAQFNRAYNLKAQAAARREWVYNGELTAEQLVAEQRRLRAESTIANAQLGRVA